MCADVDVDAAAGSRRILRGVADIVVGVATGAADAAGVASVAIVVAAVAALCSFLVMLRLLLLLLPCCSRGVCC